MHLKKKELPLSLYFKAVLQLFTASLLWGLGFVASVWSIHFYTPSEAVTYRFFLAFVLGQTILFFGKDRLKYINIETIKKSLPAGLLLGLMQLTQTIGMKTTTAGKSGFITSLYVIIVPLIGTFFLKKKASVKLYGLVAITMFGLFLLMNTELNNLTIGDVWTLACALLAAIHIIYIGQISDETNNPFQFNTYQSFWAFVTVLPFLLFQKNITIFTTDTKSLIGLALLCIGSSLIAFYLQIKAQKILSNNTTVMISLLESPLAALFAFYLLNENLTSTQIFGAVLIFCSSILTLFMNTKK